MGLRETINTPDMQTQLADDCAKLMDEQVAAKTGLGGLAIKAAYGALKGIGPGYVPRAIRNLMPNAIVAIDPLWQEGVSVGDPVIHLTDNKSQAAEILLSVTDDKIAKANNKVVIATYNKLRKSVKGDVEAAVPGLASILRQYA
ncbi:MAG: hypothetical protein HC810_00325 [Acaryochloridaceae cyanobacterium RL_2_7]|nr:hypothetical protein [Acaryochloridaceae cyanobacterium RL_2_7]